MIEFRFVFGMPIKTLGLLGKNRVGRVTGNTHFCFGLIHNKLKDEVYRGYLIFLV